MANQLLGGVDGIDRRLGPSAPEAKQLSPVDPADAREAGDCVAVAPPTGGFGPFPGAYEVGELAAGRDRPAIDEAGRVGRELAADGGRGGLVDQGHALGQAALCDQDPALDMHRHHLAVTVTMTAADFDRE